MFYIALDVRIVAVSVCWQNYEYYCLQILLNIAVGFKQILLIQIIMYFF